MKQQIKLNEGQLQQIIKESVKRVLKEREQLTNLEMQKEYYHILCNLEADIKTVIHNTDKTSRQAFDSPEEKLMMIARGISSIDKNIGITAEQAFKELIDVLSKLQNIRISLKTFNAEDKYWGHDFSTPTSTPDGTVGLSNYN